MIDKDFRLSEFLNIFTPEDVDRFIKDHSKVDINKKEIKESDIRVSWTFVGGNINNNASISILSDPNKGIIERLTNAIDAVIDKKFVKLKLKPGVDSDVVVNSAFPNYYKHKIRMARGNKKATDVYEARDKVFLVFNDGSRSTKPTVDIMDLGTGIRGENFSKTILSLQNGNKSTSDKNHLIGSFGQGGSTTLGHSYTTVIISKVNKEYFGTLVRHAEIDGQKSLSYIFFTNNGSVPNLVNDLNLYNSPDYIQKFINSDSGTLVRMIDMEVGIEYRRKEITKPLSLMDYVDIELYNTPLPIKILDYRSQFKGNSSSQARYAHGTKNRLNTSEHIVKKYSGKMTISHNGRPYDIEYFTILPVNTEDWASDKKCKDVYKRFNMHEDPLIYIMNGQYISSERFTRFRNTENLRFLGYRLLVVVNLDVLGKGKYKFVTSNRTSIHQTDLSKGFFDLVLSQLKEEESLKELNGIIAELSLTNPVGEDVIREISESVKNIYSGHIKSSKKDLVTIRKGSKGKRSETEYFDRIQRLKISNTKQKIYRNQAINIVVETDAYKHVNEKSIISLFVNGKSLTNENVSYLNGRIQYNLESLTPGLYEIHCEQYEDSICIEESNVYEFEVLELDKLDKPQTQSSNIPDIQIRTVHGSETIIDISDDKDNKVITVFVCQDQEDYISLINTGNADKNADLQIQLVQPIVLYALFLKDTYTSIENSFEKNKLILAFINTMIEGNLIGDNLH